MVDIKTDVPAIPVPTEDDVREKKKNLTHEPTTLERCNAFPQGWLTSEYPGD